MKVAFMCWLWLYNVQSRLDVSNRTDLLTACCCAVCQIGNNSLLDANGTAKISLIDTIFISCSSCREWLETAQYHGCEKSVVWRLCSWKTRNCSATAQRLQFYHLRHTHQRRMLQYTGSNRCISVWHNIFGCWPSGVELPVNGRYVSTVSGHLLHSTQDDSVYWVIC